VLDNIRSHWLDLINMREDCDAILSFRLIALYWVDPENVRLALKMSGKRFYDALKHLVVIGVIDAQNFHGDVRIRKI
jgi:hypothetical protein